MEFIIWIVILAVIFLSKYNVNVKKNGKKWTDEINVYRASSPVIPGGTKNPNAEKDAWGRRVVSDAERERLNEYRKKKASQAGNTVTSTSGGSVKSTAYRYSSTQSATEYRDARPTTAAKTNTVAGNGKVSGSKAADGVSTVDALRKKAAQKAQTTIVERAKQNTSKLAEDETLKEIEKEHGHSEAEAHVEDGHSRNCAALKKGTGAEAVQESMLPSLEDLMVKGYDGNLTFERDFLAEASDMLAAISMPDTTLKQS